MKPRPSLVVCLVLALLGWCLAGDVSGPEPRAATSNTAPVQVGAVAYPSPVASPVAQGKVDRLTTDGTGLLWTRIVGSVAATLASGNVSASGLAAHDAAVSGNPLLTGGYAHAVGTLPTAVSADGDAARTLVDAYGRLRVSLESALGASVATGYGVFVQGARAHDATIDTVAPIVAGLTAQNALPSAVSADGDVVRAVGTREGQLRVILDANANAVGISNYSAPSHAGGGTEVTVKASAGLVKYLHVSNPNTTDVYLHLWDASNPTPGTTDPTACYCVPGGTGASNRGIYDLVLPEPGLAFGTAITATVTTAANGSSAPGSAVTLQIGYK